MKREHYEHVAKKYNTIEYNEDNIYFDMDELVKIENLKVSEGGKYALQILYNIDYINSTINLSGVEHVIMGIPSKELAEEILQYMIDTEILFI